jgi:hypothetical protein
VPGIAAAGALTLLSAIEASVVANRSQRGASILAVATAVQAMRTPRGDAGLGITFRF